MTKYSITFGWDIISWNEQKKVHEYFEFDKYTCEYVYSHDVPEEEWLECSPELGDFEYLAIAEF